MNSVPGGAGLSGSVLESGNGGGPDGRGPFLCLWRLLYGLDIDRRAVTTGSDAGEKQWTVRTDQELSKLWNRST